MIVDTLTPEVVETPGKFTAVLAAIVADSRDTPSEYLDEIEVPHGGE